jgi:hypothetical protein
MVTPVKGSARKAVGEPEPDAGKAAFKAQVEQEFKAKLEEKELDSFRDVRGGASDDPGMQARQAAEGDSQDKLKRLAHAEVQDVTGAPALERAPDGARIAALLDAMPESKS